ncbi:MAG: F0F1 ATP synthase subunit delta [bacterium]|nr:F0F1 ATP synthase subunit delta [bacterium]
MRYPSSIYASSLLEASKGKKLSKEVARRFFVILMRNGDTAKLPEILKNLEELYYKKEGITKVEVFSVRDVKEEIEPELKKLFGHNMVTEFNIDKEIVGGVILKINNELVIDASVKRRLEKLFSK